MRGQSSTTYPAKEKVASVLPSKAGMPSSHEHLPSFHSNCCLVMMWLVLGTGLHLKIMTGIFEVKIPGISNGHF